MELIERREIMQRLEDMPDGEEQVLTATGHHFGEGFKDEEELFAFYDFPAAYWRSIRTTNPIESTFSTIRLRTAKTRNCLSEKSALSLVHQFAMSAEKRWGPLRGLRHLADVITDVRFVNGVNEKETGREAAELRTTMHNIYSNSPCNAGFESSVTGYGILMDYCQKSIEWAYV